MMDTKKAKEQLDFIKKDNEYRELSNFDRIVSDKVHKAIIASKNEAHVSIDIHYKAQGQSKLLDKNYTILTQTDSITLAMTTFHITW